MTQNPIRASIERTHTYHMIERIIWIVLLAATAASAIGLYVTGETTIAQFAWGIVGVIALCFFVLAAVFVGIESFSKKEIVHSLSDVDSDHPLVAEYAYITIGDSSHLCDSQVRAAIEAQYPHLREGDNALCQKGYKDWTNYRGVDSLRIARFAEHRFLKVNVDGVEIYLLDLTTNARSLRENRPTATGDQLEEPDPADTLIQLQ